MAERYAAKMEWVSDQERLQRVEHWRDEYEAFQNPEIEVVQCDCEDLMLSGCHWVFAHGILRPADYGYSLVCTPEGRAAGAEFDHARAWFYIDNRLYYQDCYSRRPMYREGNGPDYIKVRHSTYKRPRNWKVTE